MGWSYDDLLATPVPVIEEIVKLMAEQAEEQRQREASRM